MARRTMLGLVMGCLVLAVAARAEAAPISFTEVFQFPDVPGFPAGIPAGQNYYIGTESTFCGGGVCQATSALVLFDLSNIGNVSVYQGMLVDTALNLLAGPLALASHAATTDASGYVPGSGLDSATLTLRGGDAENDNVLIQAFAADTGAILYQQTLTGAVASTSVSIPFNAAMLAALASDGQFGIIATTFGTNINTADWNLESAQLEASAVPEPATLTLLGIGLGAAALRRRKRN
jgi:PEP-CTERM motif